MESNEETLIAPLLKGRYRLEHCIGSGGTSRVYRAQDTLLKRTVAVKMLHVGDDTIPLGVENLRRETTLLASLSHPSLVALYDASLDLPHPRFLVMEFVDGPTLARRLLHGPLSTSDAARIGHGLADALRLVHQHGVVHRDVTPSNVLLSRSTDDDGWTAKLTDFGIAVHPHEARRASPGIAVGTAAYLAPEQVRSDPISGAVDVYALGLVLLEALTGEPAFSFGRDAQTALSHLVAEPRIPDDLGAEWTRLLSRMTLSEPERRPTAGDVTEQLAALATGNGRSVSARRT